MQNLEPQDKQLRDLVRRAEGDGYLFESYARARPTGENFADFFANRDATVTATLNRVTELDLATQEPSVYGEVIRRLDIATGESHPSLMGLSRAARRETVLDTSERQRLYQRAVARERMNVLPFMSAVKIFPYDSGKRDVPAHF